MVNLVAYGQTDVGLVRPTNEDAFVIADLTDRRPVEKRSVARFKVGERGVLLAVSDGMGGERAGEVASTMVIESMRRSMTVLPSIEPIHEIVEQSAEAANREVWTAAQRPELTGMGATLTALHFHGTSVYIAEVGDSRAYLLRGGCLVQVTRDQSYVQMLIDSGALTPEQAETAPLRNVILQAMGVKADVSVALGRLELRQRDCFLLCSDGLSNKVSASEMQQVMLAAPTIEVACTTLINLAKQRGGEDNITVLIGVVSGDLPPLVEGETVAETLQILQEAPELGALGVTGA
ncbi:MAG: serine/threonine-protein phosphatase [Deltaproteobacteria bacterium]|nr:serine/threonine-protein phosphatase [Deltaproteobacteria bacterium]